MQCRALIFPAWRIALATQGAFKDVVGGIGWSKGERGMKDGQGVREPPTKGKHMRLSQY